MFIRVDQEHEVAGQRGHEFQLSQPATERESRGGLESHIRDILALRQALAVVLGAREEGHIFSVRAREHTAPHFLQRTRYRTCCQGGIELLWVHDRFVLIEPELEEAHDRPFKEIRRVQAPVLV